MRRRQRLGRRMPRAARRGRLAHSRLYLVECKKGRRVKPAFFCATARRRVLTTTGGCLDVRLIFIRQCLTRGRCYGNMTFAAFRSRAGQNGRQLNTGV